MTVQLDGQTDLLELLEVAGGEWLNEPFYECVCGGRLACNSSAVDVAHYSIKHRGHVEAFAVAQWEGVADLTTSAPHPVNLGMRYVCPCCGSNWGELKPEVLERLRGEHQEVEPGICRHMHWIQEKLDALHRGEWETTLVWTDDSKAAHLANITGSRDTTWAHYNGRNDREADPT